MLKPVEHGKKKYVIPNQVLNLFQDLSISELGRRHIFQKISPHPSLPNPAEGGTFVKGGEEGFSLRSPFPSSLRGIPPSRESAAVSFHKCEIA
jgi:hypothetical protein